MCRAARVGYATEGRQEIMRYYDLLQSIKKQWLPAEDVVAVEADGEHLMGWCPIHDDEHVVGEWTAKFTLERGHMKCLAVPPCHAPKKGMSLWNVHQARHDMVIARLES